MGYRWFLLFLFVFFWVQGGTASWVPAYTVLLFVFWVKSLIIPVVSVLLLSSRLLLYRLSLEAFPSVSFWETRLRLCDCIVGLLVLISVYCLWLCLRVCLIFRSVVGFGEVNLSYLFRLSLVFKRWACGWRSWDRLEFGSFWGRRKWMDHCSLAIDRLKNCRLRTMRPENRFRRGFGCEWSWTSVFLIFASVVA